MWLNKDKYNELEKAYQLIQETELKKEKLEKLILQCEKIQEAPNVRYFTVEEPEEDEKAAYWDSITKIIDNKYFTWFIFCQRERMLNQLGQNPERFAGGIEALDILLQEMHKLKIAYKNLLEAENVKRSDEN